MGYATAADLITRFSPEEIAQRAAPEGVRVKAALLQLTISAGVRTAYSSDEIAAADAALVRLNKAISDAQADVDARLAKRFKVALDPVPRILVRITCDLARYYLYDDAVEKDTLIDRRYKAALDTLDQIAAGDVKIGEDQEPAAAPAAQSDTAQTTGSPRVFTRDNLRDY